MSSSVPPLRSETVAVSLMRFSDPELNWLSICSVARLLTVTDGELTSAPCDASESVPELTFVAPLYSAGLKSRPSELLKYSTARMPLPLSHSWPVNSLKPKNVALTVRACASGCTRPLPEIDPTEIEVELAGARVSFAPVSTRKSEKNAPAVLVATYSPCSTRTSSKKFVPEIVRVPAPVFKNPALSKG